MACGQFTPEYLGKRRNMGVKEIFETMNYGPAPESATEAMAWLESLFAVSKANNEGTAIPEIVEAVLEEDADEEISEMVLLAMESRSGSITNEEILDGILKLQEWRLDQT